MPELQALSKDSLRIELESREEVISTGDVLRFKRDYGRYEEGSKVKVEPDIGPNDRYVLKSWSEAFAVHYIGEDLIKKLFSENVVEIE